LREGKARQLSTDKTRGWEGCKGKRAVQQKKGPVGEKQKGLTFPAFFTLSGNVVTERRNGGIVLSEIPTKDFVIRTKKGPLPNVKSRRFRSCPECRGKRKKGSWSQGAEENRYWRLLSAVGTPQKESKGQRPWSG